MITIFVDKIKTLDQISYISFIDSLDFNTLTCTCFNKLMNTIGKGEGISSKEVEKEIQIAIDLGFDNPDAAIRAEWKKIPVKGERPTPQEVIEYLCKEMKKKQ